LIQNPRFFDFDGLQGRPLGGSIPFTRSIRFLFDPEPSIF
jgi:hypothetical protein